jgi:integrase
VQPVPEHLSRRPNPKDTAAEGLLLVTKFGGPWASGGAASAVTHEISKLLRKVGVSRPGLGFYALRHTFRTVADATKDPNAIRLIMGHTDDRIDDNYTQGIEDIRLKAVTDHDRCWLYGAPSSTLEGEPR